MQRERKAHASARAEAYAPKPTGGSVMAGLSVGVVAFGVSYGVLRFYGHALADYPLVVALLVAASTLIAFAAYKRAARRHRRAYRYELDRTERQDGEPTESR